MFYGFIQKKRKTSSVEDVANHSLPQDFIEKQRAYFAEIDAFELSEEEASADDLEWRTILKEYIT